MISLEPERLWAWDSKWSIEWLTLCPVAVLFRFWVAKATTWVETRSSLCFFSLGPPLSIWIFDPRDSTIRHRHSNLNTNHQQQKKSRSKQQKTYSSSSSSSKKLSAILFFILQKYLWLLVFDFIKKNDLVGL
mgnify:CR=1 FL=1